MHVESVLFFETPEQIYERVFRTLKPRTPLPRIVVEFRRFANANSTVQLKDGCMTVKMTDLLESAPAPILEALAYILISKLYRKPVPRLYSHRYRLYLNRKDVRHSLEQVRQERGRKEILPAAGETYDLAAIFEDINLRYFNGLMARPGIGWSRRVSRRTLGHYDPSHHVIILSRILDRPQVPKLAVEYVMFHEMLHLRHPEQHHGGRRHVHTREFKQAEKQFERRAEAQAMLKAL